MYVVDPETHTTGLPGRPSRPNKLERIYRTACCGSVAGIILWILALLMVVFVPLGVILARNNVRRSIPCHIVQDWLTVIRTKAHQRSRLYLRAPW